MTTDAVREVDGARTRISVMRDRHLVPLLAGAQGRCGKTQPWGGVLLEQHQVQPSEIPEHEHPELCLHLQTSGDRDFEWWSAGKHAVERTRSGSLIVIPPGTRDRLRWTGVSERLIVSMDAKPLEDLAREWGGKGAPEFRGTWSHEDPALQGTLAEMGREAREAFPLGKLYSDLLAIDLRGQLLRRYAADPVRGPVVCGGLGRRPLRRALEYINAHLEENLRLEEVASVLELSASHFAHEFRASTGKTPYQYLLDQRIRKAQTLLSSTKLPVQVIAATVGYGSAVNFVRAFRQRVGTTPAAWRTGA